MALAGTLALVALHPRRAPRLTLTLAGIASFGLIVTLAVPDPYESALEHRYPGERVLWQEEGVQTTVSIHETFDGGRAMYLDGLHQASTHPDVLRFHRLIGALPATLHPEPRRALVVGLGGGATPGALATVDGVRVDIVELSEEVVRGARLFADVNYDVIDRATSTSASTTPATTCCSAIGGTTS